MASAPNPFKPHVELPKAPRDAGKGNALFLADRANGANIQTLRANTKAGKYPNLHGKWAKQNLKFWGMI